jgi:hypothetical protein
MFCGTIEQVGLPFESKAIFFGIYFVGLLSLSFSPMAISVMMLPGIKLWLFIISHTVVLFHISKLALWRDSLCSACLLIWL